MGFVHTAKGNLNFHFGFYTVTLGLPGDPSPLRRTTHENAGNTEENRDKNGSPRKPLELLSPVLPEAGFVYPVLLSRMDPYIPFLLKSVCIVFLSFAEKKFFFFLTDEAWAIGGNQ